MKKLFIAIVLSIGAICTYAEDISPNNHDEALSDLAFMLTEEIQNPVVKREILDPKKLDYSMESLKFIDSYLAAIRTADFDQASDDQQLKTVLRTGAYVGETIRKNDQSRQWHWIDLNTAKMMNPELFAKMTPSLELMAILTDGQVFTFPLNKVVKYLQNGEEDSLYFYAVSSMKLK